MIKALIVPDFSIIRAAHPNWAVNHIWAATIGHPTTWTPFPACHRSTWIRCPVCSRSHRVADRTSKPPPPPQTHTLPPINAQIQKKKYLLKKNQLQMYYAQIRASNPWYGRCFTITKACRSQAQSRSTTNAQQSSSDNVLWWRRQQWWWRCH